MLRVMERYTMSLPDVTKRKLGYSRKDAENSPQRALRYLMMETRLYSGTT